MREQTVPATHYDRPIKATLHVHLDNGESWAVTAADLQEFGLITRHEAYMAFDDALSKVLRDAGLITRDITDAQLNPVRYLAETAIVFPDLLDHEEHEGWREVVEIEQALQLLAVGDVGEER